MRLILFIYLSIYLFIYLFIYLIQQYNAYISFKATRNYNKYVAILMLNTTYNGISFD